MEIVFVTSNQNKVREAEQILGMKLESISADVPEIQAIQVREVVEDKAKAAYEKIRRPLIVEDTGLYIESLNGFPGALIKWFLKSVGNAGICNLLKGVSPRKAYAETCICFYDGKELKTFWGRIDGSITESPQGETRFGWDPIFIPEGYKKSFAELGAEEKNKISMRRKAFLGLKEFLNNSA